MSRATLTTLAAAMAALFAGCAHCDTCDDFPSPCYDCGYASSGMAMGEVIGPASPMDQGAPMMGGMGQPGAGMPDPGIMMSSPEAAPGPGVAPGGETPRGPVDLNGVLEDRPLLDDVPPVPPLPDPTSPSGSPFRG